jgi:CheY-like chemotaxis protein
MTNHQLPTSKQTVRSTMQHFQSTSSDDLRSKFQGFNAMIDANDRCLIVEDNFFIYMAMEDIVASFGFKQIDRASSVAEARDHLKNHHYRLALLDFRLGVLQSVPLMETLERSKIPFGVTTGYTVDDVMLRALKGAPVISKPYVSETVNNVISELLTT